ncbi:MAG: hypothetical protein WCG61_05580 [Chlorobium sp.]
MKLSVFLIMALMSAVLAGCDAKKYELVGAGNSCAYKMDKDTGQIWFISPEGERKLPLAP